MDEVRGLLELDGVTLNMRGDTDEAWIVELGSHLSFSTDLNVR